MPQLIALLFFSRPCQTGVADAVRPGCLARNCSRCFVGASSWDWAVRGQAGNSCKLAEISGSFLPCSGPGSRCTGIHWSSLCFLFSNCIQNVIGGLCFSFFCYFTTRSLLVHFSFLFLQHMVLHLPQSHHDSACPENIELGGTAYRSTNHNISC